VNHDLKQFIESVELQDIHLDSFTAKTISRGQMEATPRFQLMEKREFLGVVLSEPDHHTMEVRYSLGALLTGEAEEGGDDPPKVAIVEAEVVAIYQLSQPHPVDSKVAEEFARTSVLFNLWPFWREFVQETSIRLRWPMVTLPLLKFTKSAPSLPNASTALQGSET